MNKLSDYQISEKKNNLEQRLFNLINNFEEETGVKVKTIALSKESKQLNKVILKYR